MNNEAQACFDSIFKETELIQVNHTEFSIIMLEPNVTCKPARAVRFLGNWVEDLM
jgi:hypothetical protein